MRIFRQIRLAALVGIVGEFILVAPLFVVSRSQLVDTIQLPLWVDVLEQFQKPGFPLVERLYFTHWMVHLAARLPDHSALDVLEGLAILIQATIFAFIALGVMYLLRATNGRILTLLRKRVLLAVFLPPAIVIVIGAVWPLSDLVSEDVADTLVVASSFWLVLAALVGTTLAVTRKSLRTDGRSP
jgi:hypothetical protein